MKVIDHDKQEDVISLQDLEDKGAADYYHVFALSKTTSRIYIVKKRKECIGLYSVKSL